MVGEGGREGGREEEGRGREERRGGHLQKQEAQEKQVCLSTMNIICTFSTDITLHLQKKRRGGGRKTNVRREERVERSGEEERGEER